MRSYQNLVITGSINLLGGLEATASRAVSTSFTVSAMSASNAQTASNLVLLTQPLVQISNRWQSGNSRASGSLSFAQGNEAYASGAYTTALGHFTEAQGAASVVVGERNITYGACSFAAGAFTTSSARGQVVLGTFNATSSNANDVVLIGGGTAAQPRNVAVFSTGSVTLSGSVNISGSLSLNGAPVGRGGASVIISGSIPSGSQPSGTLWFNNQEGNLYIQYSGPTGSTYIPAVNSVAGGAYGATFRNAYSASTWTVNHGLNTTTPIIQVYSGSQTMIPASIVSTSPNISTITFANIVSGSVVAASGIGGQTSSSYALTSVNSISSSFATNANTSISSSFAVSSSLAVSSSFATSSSFASTSISSSFAISSSRAVTSSFALTSISSSFATNAVTASTNTLTYASIGVSAIPAASNSDMTPTILNGNGITVSGNTIIIERPGVYLLNASIGIRATFAEYAWVDASNNRLAGTNTGLAGSLNSTDPAAPVSAMGIVNITSPNTVIKLRIFVGAAFLTQNTAYAVATITQLR
jgi:hypothetical protein